MGADVIKVESPEGDLMRQWPPILDGYSQYFASVNRNKRSVVLDLKQETDKAEARKLALTADILLENFRPGVMAKFGLDYASLSKDHPALVYCSVSAFGQTGPRATEGGFDMTVQAMSGVMSVTGDKDGRPANAASRSPISPPGSMPRSASPPPCTRHAPPDTVIMSMCRCSAACSASPTCRPVNYLVRDGIRCAWVLHIR
jgi:hypothetical protein